MSTMRIIDGDGHIRDDQQGIAKHMPPHYEPVGGGGRVGGVFPPLDHMHLNLGRARPDALQTPGSGFPEGVGPEEWIQFMDQAGIESTILYPTSGLAYGKIINRDWAIAATRAYNEWLHEVYLTKSPRFGGMGLIPLQDPEAAVEELRHVVEDLGMCGAVLPSTGLKGHLGHKEYWPVYAEAERLGCCLAVHGGCHSGMGLDDLNVFATVHALGHPYGILISFAGMIANGIFDRFPNLQVAYLEGGVSWFLMALERFDGSYNAYTPENPTGELLQFQGKEKVSDYIARHVEAGRILVGVEGDELPLAFAVKAVGNKAFLYSSDFPHEGNNVASCRHEIEELLENEGLTTADKEAILYKNAERFYKVQPVAVGA